LRVLVVSSELEGAVDTDRAVTSSRFGDSTVFP
jgi:hypothetical protein